MSVFLADVAATPEDTYLSLASPAFGAGGDRWSSRRSRSSSPARRTWPPPSRTSSPGAPSAVRGRVMSTVATLDRGARALPKLRAAGRRRGSAMRG